MCLMRTQFDDEPGARKTMLRRVTIQPDIQMDLWFEGGRAVVQDVATGVLSYGATGICALIRALQAREANTPFAHELMAGAELIY